MQQPPHQTSTVQVNVELATEADIPSILDLMAHCMPHLKRTREQLMWQYFRAPFGEVKLFVVRNPKQEVAALYSTVAQNFRVDGAVVPGRMQLDVMTHTDYRGQGLHSHLMRTCLENAKKAGEIAYGFPNEQAVGGFRRNSGRSLYQELCKVPLRVKALSLQKTPMDSSNLISVEAPFNQVATEIWNATSFRVAINRDAAYLNWRYSKPGQTYFRFRLKGDMGILVLKLFDLPDARVMHICELHARTTASSEIQKTLTSCEEFGRLHGANRITAWLPCLHPYAEQFDRFGLNLVDHNRSIFFWAPEQLEGPTQEASHWHLTMGDSDVF